MRSFVYESLPGRVIFGQPVAEALPAEIERLSLRRVLVLSTPEQIETGKEIAALLSGRAAGVYPQARMHTPVEVTEEAIAHAAALDVDGIVSVGGGSTIGLGKAISFRTGLPHVTVPTTYAGSEVTPILGETQSGVKTTKRDIALLPQVVIYDVALTLSLPVPLSVTSGMNAIAHAAEALYAKDRNPILSALAEKGIAAVARAIPQIVAHPTHVEARSDALFGAWLCGTCLGTVGMALHHKLAHVLGGRFDLPHAALHTALLPHTLAYNAAAAPDAMRAITQAIGAEDAPQGLYELARSSGATMALRDLGMPEDGISAAAHMTMNNPYWNPRPLEVDAIIHLLADAWAGKAPPQTV